MRKLAPNEPMPLLEELPPMPAAWNVDYRNVEIPRSAPGTTNQPEAVLDAAAEGKDAVPVDDNPDQLLGYDASEEPIGPSQGDDDILIAEETPAGLNTSYPYPLVLIPPAATHPLPRAAAAAEASGANTPSVFLSSTTVDVVSMGVSTTPSPSPNRIITVSPVWIVPEGQPSPWPLPAAMLPSPTVPMVSSADGLTPLSQ